ncbi:HNH endonuclease [Halobacteria archaeon AArc-dxtr1]|nr:HNH endonuclease [Halobacteria archaeon AArc-dxtr1]
MDCPTCGKSLRTEQGMRQHHTKVHDKPIPNRTCNGCETEFYDSKARREFCENCNPNAGEHNGNWNGGNETTTCKLCGETFEYYPSDKLGVYCPDCVEAADGQIPENPSTKGPRVQTNCRHCAAVLEIRPSRIESRTRGVFCSLECYGGWLSANVVGPDHHQWEGGPIEYGREWWRIRRQALERDGYECQECGAGPDELGRNPDVHHQTPVRSFGEPEDAHTLDNVISLCRPCHRRAESKTRSASTADEK